VRLFPRLADESDRSQQDADAAHEAASSIFVPADKAAICADCGGIFLYTTGACPGCGSHQWVLLNPSLWVAKAMREAK
jgi:hypothetical protein